MGIKVRKQANASWSGDVPSGTGHIRVQSGALDAAFSLRARDGTGDDDHTNPEELIGAALAGCFAMSLSNLLAEFGNPAAAVNARATVHLEQQSSGFSITKIELDAVGDVNGVDDETFVALATQAKETCPVSRALAGTTISLTAALSQHVR